MSSPFTLSDRAPTALSHRSYSPDTLSALRTAGSNLLAILIGAYVLFKALEITGYPVWLWLHHLLQMASDTVPDKLAVVLFNKQADASDPDQDVRGTDTTSRAGNTLSGMFGLTSGGILGKGLSGVTGALSKNYRNVPAGLGNWDNSCYQNSVIQGLASLPSLRDYLLKTTAEYHALDAESTNGALFDMINKLNNPDHHGQNFWIRGKLKSMSTFQQQDAQEYYSKIMDELDKEVKNASSSKRRSSASWLSTVTSLSEPPATVTEEEQPMKVEAEPADVKDKNQASPDQPHIVPNPLDGLLAQRVGCVNCGYTEGLSLIPFNCITVPLGRAWVYDVRECLDEYTNLELIEGVECAKCTLLKMEKTTKKLADAQPAVFGPRLQAIQEVLEEEDFEDKTLIKNLGLSKKVWVQSTKSRQAIIARAPKSLVLHVNRSIFDEMTGAQYKNNANVLYPKTLDLGTWCLGSRPSESHKPDESIEESWPRDPTKSMLVQSDPAAANDSPFRYALRAAITHFGNHGNGHYICYRQLLFSSKQPKTSDKEIEETQEITAEEIPAIEDATEEIASHEQWWRLSDENVYEIQEEDALRQQNVFMLFYERLDDISPPPAEARPMDFELAATAEAIPLPPDVSCLYPAIFDDTAADIPLPKDALDSLPPSPPASPRISQPDIGSSPVSSATSDLELRRVDGRPPYPTPPSETPSLGLDDETEVSEPDTSTYESEDTPSTHFTSDDEVSDEVALSSKDTIISHRSTSVLGFSKMRTAGDLSPRKRDGSLPMVTAL